MQESKLHYYNTIQYIFEYPRKYLPQCISLSTRACWEVSGVVLLQASAAPRLIGFIVTVELYRAGTE